MTVEIILAIVSLCTTIQAAQPTTSEYTWLSKQNLRCQQYYVQCLTTNKNPIDADKLAFCIKEK